MGRRSDNVVRLNVADAENTMRTRLNECLGYEAEWLEEYAAVSEWLADNYGQGLILSGDPGRGKSLIATKVIPSILHSLGYAVAVYDARTAADHINVITQQKILVLDDAGEEGTAVNFGNKIDIIPQVADMTEKTNKLIILTSNLSRGEFAAKYGRRCIERLSRMCRWIQFSGESMRTSATPDRPITTPDLPPEKPTDREDKEVGWGIVAKRLGINPQECEARAKIERQRIAEDVRNNKMAIPDNSRYVLTDTNILGYIDGKSITHIALNRLGLEDEQICNIGQELEQYRIKLIEDEKRRREMAILTEAV